MYNYRIVLLVTAGCLVGALPQPGWTQAEEAEVEEIEPQADCELLQDPQMRQKIGSALELKLRMLCEEPTEENPAEPAVTRDREVEEQSEEALEPREASILPRDVRVNDPGQDIFPNTTQFETSIVAVARRVCAAWLDTGQLAAGLSGFGFSRNQGRTWTDQGAFPPGAGGTDLAFGDPSLAHSVRDRTFYYAALSSVGLSLWRSRNGCRQFRYVGPIHIGGGDDKEFIAVDNNRRSPHFGRIYVGWTNFTLADDLNQTSFSDNGGRTWSTPVSLPGSGVNGQGMWPAVAPNGDVYFALLDGCFTIGCLQDQRIYSSVTGGVTWFEVTPIGENQLRPEDVASTNNCSRQALGGNIRNQSFPQIAIHRDSRVPAGYVIHAVYHYDSDGAGPDESNVFYKRSVDAGFTWSAEIQLNDDATTTDQWFPALAVNDRGVVVASWYDRRVDTANNLAFARFADVSRDGGITWGPNFRVSDVNSPMAQTLPHFDPAGAPCHLGDYDQIAFSGNNAHIIWSDNRRVTVQGPNPDIYAKTINLRPRRHSGVLVAAE